MNDAIKDVVQILTGLLLFWIAVLSHPHSSIWTVAFIALGGGLLIGWPIGRWISEDRNR